MAGKYLRLTPEKPLETAQEIIDAMASIATPHDQVRFLLTFSGKVREIKVQVKWPTE